MIHTKTWCMSKLPVFNNKKSGLIELLLKLSFVICVATLAYIFYKKIYMAVSNKHHFICNMHGIVGLMWLHPIHNLVSFAVQSFTKICLSTFCKSSKAYLGWVWICPAVRNILRQSTFTPTAPICVFASLSQQISREKLIFLSPPWCSAGSLSVVLTVLGKQNTQCSKSPERPGS